jgi:hypothetical protein
MIRTKYVEAGRPFLMADKNKIVSAFVIGVNGDEALVEFEAMNGRTKYSALRIINVYDNPMKENGRPRRNVTYADDWGGMARFPFIENAALNNRRWLAKPRTSKVKTQTVQEAYEEAKRTYHRKYVKKANV